MWVFPEIRTLGDIPRYHARRRPDGAALIAHGQTVTFAQLDRESNRVANGLIARRLAAAACVGFLGKNTPILTFALLGTAKAGLTFMPLNWRLAASELAVILADSECGLLFVDEEFLPLARAAVAEAAIAPSLIVISSEAADEASWPGFMAACASDDPGLEVAGETTALRIYTSGTTGLPKGVELTHDNFNFARLCEHLETAMPWSYTDVFLMFMPNFHTAGSGLMLQSLYNGGAVSMLPAFEPVDVLRAISETRPSIILIVPSALQMLLDHPMAADVDFSCLKLCMYAGSPISVPLITQAMARMQCGFAQWYGATETVGAVTLLRNEQHRLGLEHDPKKWTPVFGQDHAQDKYLELDDDSKKNQPALDDKLKSCGTPLPLIDIRVVGPDGSDVAAGEVGEIWIRTPTLFKGYWKRPSETAAVKVNGWYRSGDAGYRDGDGYLYIHDRIKDMIISGGENIYSAEIERVLERHPMVAQVAVIGVPDPKWGEAVKALVVLRDGSAATEAELIAFCRKHIGGYKVPKSVEFVGDFPRTPSGKIQKAVLRAPYWGGRTRAVA